MKRVFIFGALAIVIALIGGAVLGRYQQYHNKQTQIMANAALAARASSDALDRADAVLKDATVKINTIRAECEKGKAAYDALPPTTKAKYTAPICATP